MIISFIGVKKYEGTLDGKLNYAKEIKTNK